MPTYFIRAVNFEFSSRDSGDEYDQPEVALAVGIESAVSIAIDEINGGKHNVAVEVRIELEDGTVLLRRVVALSVSPLLVTYSHEGLSVGRFS